LNWKPFYIESAIKRTDMIYELDDEPTLEEVKLAMDGMAWNTNLLIEEVMDKLIAKMVESTHLA
jgi:hypothetical protein